MDKLTILKICGVYNFAFAIFHIMFWKIFRWKTDLQKNSVGNRAIMQILNIRLIYVFILMAVVYFFYGSQLLGFALLIGFLGFWIGRTIEQFIFLRVKSKMVTILTVIHALPLMM